MENTSDSPLKTELTQHAIKVLLVDDQAMIGEAVRRMLAPEADIRFHYCSDPAGALKMARELAPTHLCISPGPGTPGDAGVSRQMIESFAGRIPVLGVCLGILKHLYYLQARFLRIPACCHSRPVPHAASVVAPVRDCRKPLYDSVEPAY